ncbi:unnamed protein product [Arabidopsis lyrata]|nr:unnamed protein product [Arabidopsis lyrata]
MTFRSFLRIAPMLLHSRLKAKISPPLLLRRFYSTTTFDPPSSSDVETPSDPTFPRFNSEILDSSLLHSRLKAKISPPLLLRRFYSTTTFDPPSSSDDETPSDPSFFPGLTQRSWIRPQRMKNVAERVGPSVVRVVVPKRSFSSDERKGGQGSGFFIDRKRILTCAHVVAHISKRGRILSFADKVKIKALNVDGVINAYVLRNSVSVHLDVAVLQITSTKEFKPLEFGISRDMRWGDWVVAFGSPLKLDRTITAGVISCIDRTDVELRLPKLERTYFQSDCPTNPGSSGGPLVNLDCRVIGLNSMGMPIATGVGFSVPIDNVREHLELKNLWWDSPCQLTTSANI